MSTENRTKVIVPCRLSYAHLWEPDSVNGSEPKYSVSCIIDKKDKDTIAKIRKAVEIAKEEGKGKWGGKIPANLKLPLRDGDSDRAEDEAYAGSMFLNANSKQAPQIVDRQVQPMVEATIALHYVFDSPQDKFVFDVSHQCYTHKILTGRKDGFTDPAHFGDYSGYTNPSESEHDVFTVGHTSTSLSLATGLAKARDLKGGTENIVAVIGDGSMSGGEAFEGLNNAAMLGSNMIIVFNDNEISIAPNFGGMYQNFDLLRKTNGTAECNFFKTFGFDYRYVADGNDVVSLVSAFSEVKDIDHPVVVHIHTLKGKGIEWCEKDKEASHYGMPANLDMSMFSGESYDTLTGDYLLKKMEDDPKIIAISPATPGLTGFTPEHRKKAGKQFIDVGIAEEHAVAFASGLAKNGAKPVLMIVSSFMQRTYDQLMQDLALNKSPATILIFLAALSPGDATHNGCFDITMTGSIPGLVCLAPTTKEEYLAMLDWSIEQTDAPVMIRVPSAVIPAGKEVSFSKDDLGKYQIAETGSKVAVLGFGSFFPLAGQVKELLKQKENKEQGICRD